jgi:hypothetical protein
MEQTLQVKESSSSKYVQDKGGLSRVESTNRLSHVEATV